MADQQQSVHIDIEAEQYMRYWSKTLHVHPVDLRAAVDAVGPRLEDVRRYLKRLTGS